MREMSQPTFDFCTLDKPLCINFSRLPVEEEWREEWREEWHEERREHWTENAREEEGWKRGGWQRGPRDGDGRCRVWCETVLSILLAAWALPSTVLYGRAAVFSLVAGATLPPLCRYSRYTPLLHVTLLFALVRALQGQSQVVVGAVYYVAMLVVYVDTTFSSFRTHFSVLACVQAGGGLLIAVLLPPAYDVVHILNESALVLTGLCFVLRTL